MHSTDIIYSKSTYSMILLNPAGLSKGVVKFNVNGQRSVHIPLGEERYVVEVVLEKSNKTA